MAEKKVATVLDIDRAYTMEFFKKASQEDREWMMERTAYWVKEKGERHYFAPNRSEFAKKFFPELFVKKAPKKKPSMLEEMARIDKELKEKGGN